MSDVNADEGVPDDDRLRDGVAHLQAAAHETIAAARALLDVADDLVSDPDKLTSVITTVTNLGRHGARARGEDQPGTDDDRGDEGGVQHIPVS